MMCQINLKEIHKYRKYFSIQLFQCFMKDPLFQRKMNEKQRKKNEKTIAAMYVCYSFCCFLLSLFYYNVHIKEGYLFMKPWNIGIINLFWYLVLFIMPD